MQTCYAPLPPGPDSPSQRRNIGGEGSAAPAAAAGGLPAAAGDSPSRPASAPALVPSAPAAGRPDASADSSSPSRPATLAISPSTPRTRTSSAGRRRRSLSSFSRSRTSLAALVWKLRGGGGETGQIKRCGRVRRANRVGHSGQGGHVPRRQPGRQPRGELTAPPPWTRTGRPCA